MVMAWYVARCMQPALRVIVVSLLRHVQTVVAHKVNNVELVISSVAISHSEIVQTSIPNASLQ